MTLDEASFYGKSHEVTITDNSLVLEPGLARVYTIDASVTGLHVKLPPANRVKDGLKTGGPIFYVINTGGNSFEVRKTDGIVVVDTVAAAGGVNENVCIVFLTDDSSANGDWFMRCLPETSTTTTPIPTTTPPPPTTQQSTTPAPPPITVPVGDLGLTTKFPPAIGEHMEGGGIMGKDFIEEGL